MTLFAIVLVAAIQGITEFLPVSSSGHLIILPAITGLDDQGQAIDVAVHVGTLFAVMLYFRSDVKSIFGGMRRLATGKMDTLGSRLLLLLILATIPVVCAGALMKLSGLNDSLRSISVVGWTTLIFGIVLWWSDQIGPVKKKGEDLTVKDAMIIGLWQAIALVPGTSRSGIAITGARFLGYSRQEAARIAMLMSIPAIISSAGYLTLETIEGANTALLRDGAIAAAFSFLAALLALRFMMTLLRTVSFTPYVIYRMFLGLLLLGIAYH
ncbi:MAG: undecaprenyl-diphosphate phosphatase [Roseovarius sp.]|nr:undecaprenyl-diphosphate phosphatase [Roseovarius sp.]MCY4206608.1 undecaprenyl-diphosphate phosphatase [Roseovarius sp.]MCY4292331.1 undecaprenyl-diphosphate phosphatase [Roseovarius sp.]MCY4314635.1 undecaprenyl-diphosphate phosphatase [Roseovarius sp.]